MQIIPCRSSGKLPRSGGVGVNRGAEIVGFDMVGRESGKAWCWNVIIEREERGKRCAAISDGTRRI